MPKPVLSDSLFNAENVAEAIVDNIDLGVLNTNLALTDVTSSFTIESGWTTLATTRAYKFNGFIFINFGCYYDSPADGTHIFTMTSDVTPTNEFVAPSASYQGDTAYYIAFKTDGTIELKLPNNPGSINFHTVVNAFYRLD
jgi:hypothetical protein